MAFSGTVASDYLKYLSTGLEEKERLIDFSVGDFATIRNNLIEYAKAVYPLDYDNYSESDFGIFLIELMAAVGHIHSYKADYLANENYLRTARDRKSVKKLLELIGVRMKGPIGAAANASIEITVPQTEDFGSTSSVIISPENRAFSITSPEDGNVITYTIYKVNNDGTVDLSDLTTNAVFSANQGDESTFTLNDVVILEGAFVVETGIFASTESVKKIALTQSPYIERSAQVFIEGSNSTQGIYKEEENVYAASGATDKVFQVITDDEFKPSILFGDSVIGLSPAIGDTYTITYRVGGGSRGNIGKGKISAPINLTLDNGISTLPIAGILENTSIATGGAGPETVAHAKKYAPLTFRRQDRLVTLADYKAFVNTFVSNYGSTGKANAITRRAYSSANIIDVFVLEKASDIQLRKATPEYKKQILDAIDDKKMITDEPVILDGLIRTLDVILNVTLDKKYKKLENEIKNKVKEKTLEFFNVDNIEFGDAFIPQNLMKYILDIPELRYVTVDNIESTIKIDFNEIIQLNNLTINMIYI